VQDSEDPRSPLHSARVSQESPVPRFGPELRRTRAAIDYAELRHNGQRRKCDGSPFILHPLEVASLLRDAGADDELIAAGVLHDVIEKCAATPAELRHRFGARVTALVRAVSEDSAISGYARRKAALREQVADAGEEALMLFAADKVSKVREFRTHQVDAPARRVTHYRRSLELLQALLPNQVLTRQLASEYQQLLARAPAAPASGR
jgi:(p)ppGpp synthase/HD superfamily hydrolase